MTGLQYNTNRQTSHKDETAIQPPTDASLKGGLFFARTVGTRAAGYRPKAVSRPSLNRTIPGRKPPGSPILRNRKSKVSIEVFRYDWGYTKIVTYLDKNGNVLRKNVQHVGYNTAAGGRPRADVGENPPAAPS